MSRQDGKCDNHPSREAVYFDGPEAWCQECNNAGLIEQGEADLCAPIPTSTFQTIDEAKEYFTPILFRAQVLGDMKAYEQALYDLVLAISTVQLREFFRDWFARNGLPDLLPDTRVEPCKLCGQSDGEPAAHFYDKCPECGRDDRKAWQEKADAGN